MLYWYDVGVLPVQRRCFAGTTLHFQISNVLLRQMQRAFGRNATRICFTAPVLFGIISYFKHLFNKKPRIFSCLKNNAFLCIKQLFKTYV